MKLSKSPKEKMVCFTEEHKLSAGSGPFPTETGILTVEEYIVLEEL